MTYAQIVDLFGNGIEAHEVSKLKLRVSIECPCLTAQELVSIFKTTFASYYTKEDEIEDYISWTNRNYHGKSMKQISDSPLNPKENLHSTNVFKGLYVLISETDFFDDKIQKKTFLNGLVSLKKDIVFQLHKNKTYRDQRLLDKFEIICEFIELVETKKAHLSEQK